ncbi:E3 ubiquitin-protein ligase RNF14-like [Cololabis saira]|uniref:E3 ubiquitin-protein ligase RNF14-like n=1 Tax=Cololabis saira TaxID=129043 RepID=UPI002AD3A7D3|nr:E3 ubiquitin-protein ligase RNF14-like [Cololabis saira]
MNWDLEEQEDELLVLESIFGSGEFLRKESSSAGEIRVSAELPADFTVLLEDGETLRQYAISFLPPLQLTFELPGDYPSSSPPSFTLTCSWLTHTQLASLAAQLSDLYQATGGAVVLFSWIQFLKEDALKFLDIQSQLELPSGEHRTQDNKETEPSAAEGGECTSEPTSDRCYDESALCGTDRWEPSTSGSSRTDCQGASALDAHRVDQNQFTSVPSQSRLNSDSETDSPNILSSETIIEKVDEQVYDVIPVKSLESNDHSSVGDKSNHPPSSQPDPDPKDLSKQEEASSPVRPSETPPNLDQAFAGLSLTPSQILLSQILIHDASQKQKVFSSTVFDCGVCYVGWLGSASVQLHECGHVFCQACLREFCRVRISEGNIRGVTCPQEGCSATPTPAQVKSLVGEDLFSRYDRLLLQFTLESMPDVTYCPMRWCSSAVIRDKSSTAAQCTVCGFAFCVVCSKTYHGTNACYEEKPTEEIEDLPSLPESEEGQRALLDDYVTGSKQRRRLLENRYGRKVLLSNLENDLNDKWKAVNTKACPHCFSPIQKDGGCNGMWCTQCMQPFLWDMA